MWGTQEDYSQIWVVFLQLFWPDIHVLIWLQTRKCILSSYWLLVWRKGSSLIWTNLPRYFFFLLIIATFHFLPGLFFFASFHNSRIDFAHLLWGTNVYLRVALWIMSQTKVVFIQVKISSATGNHANELNGVFAAEEKLYNDKPLYKKVNVSDPNQIMWIRFLPNGKWGVSSTENKDNKSSNLCWAYSENNGLSLPTDPSLWQVHTNGQWTEQKIRVESVFIFLFINTFFVTLILLLFCNEPF